MSQNAPMMNEQELTDFIETAFPQLSLGFVLERVTSDEIQIRLPVTDQHLRPGGTVSGPTLFTVADVAAYMLTLAQIGPKALAVTTNCSIDFMRKPAAEADLLVRGRLLKLGRQLSVTDVLMFSEGSEAPVARATLTYSLPPAQKAE